MKQSEKLVLDTLRKSTLAYLSETEYSALEKVVEQNGILNLTGIAQRIVKSAVIKHGSHDQSSHGNWSDGKDMSGADYSSKKEKTTIKEYKEFYEAYAEEYEFEDEDKRWYQAVETAESYTLEGYARVNKTLRNPKATAKEKKNIEKEVEVLDELMETSDDTFSKTNLYRVYDAELVEDLKPGDKLVDKGFLSTTRTNIIKDTSHRQALGEIEDSADVAAIILPNKSGFGQGVAMDLFLKANGVEEGDQPWTVEKEVLLPRNTPLEFLGWDTSGSEKVAVFQRSD